LLAATNLVEGIREESMNPMKHNIAPILQHKNIVQIDANRGKENLRLI
jgi:hypothetical protein